MYIPAETGEHYINGSFNFGACTIFPEKFDENNLNQNNTVWFEMASCNNEDIFEIAPIINFYFYLSLLSFLIRYPISEKIRYGYFFTRVQPKNTKKPFNIVEEKCSTTKIIRPWTNQFIGDPVLIIPDDTMDLVDMVFRLNEEKLKRFEKLIFCYRFALINIRRFPLASIAAFISSLDEASQYNHVIYGERNRKLNKASIKNFLKSHCMIKNWESTFNKGWNDRSKFIHSAELGFREFIFGDLDINQSIIKKGELSFQNPYQSLAQKLEPIVNSSIIDWLIKNHSD